MSATCATCRHWDPPAEIGIQGPLGACRAALLGGPTRTSADHACDVQLAQAPEFVLARAYEPGEALRCRDCRWLMTRRVGGVALDAGTCVASQDWATAPLRESARRCDVRRAGRPAYSARLGATDPVSTNMEAA